MNDNTEEPVGHPAKRDVRHRETSTEWLRSHRMTKTVRPLGIVSRMMVAGTGERGAVEASKLLHFVSFPEKSLWKSPDLTPPPENQSEPLASPGNRNQGGEMGTNQHPWPARETRTNQNSTPNPSPEGDQSDPDTPGFRIFPEIITYISNVTQSSGLLPMAAASVSVGAPARAW